MKFFVVCICFVVASAQTGSKSQDPNPSLPVSYAFGFNDAQSFRSEYGDEKGRKYGSYGIQDNGRVRIVNYVADENGFRADIKSNENNLREPTRVDPANTNINKVYLPIVLTNGPIITSPIYHGHHIVFRPQPWLGYSNAIHVGLNPLGYPIYTHSTLIIPKNDKDN